MLIFPFLIEYKTYTTWMNRMEAYHEYTHVPLEYYKCNVDGCTMDLRNNATWSFHRISRHPNAQGSLRILNAFCKLILKYLLKLNVPYLCIFRRHRDP